MDVDDKTSLEFVGFFFLGGGKKNAGSPVLYKSWPFTSCKKEKDKISVVYVFFLKTIPFYSLSL